MPKPKATREAFAPLLLPEIREHRTSGGLQVLSAERGPLPLVSLRLTVENGSAADPEGQPGLMCFAANLLRRGTRSMSADQINEAVEFVGASLGVGVGEDFTSLRITTPAEHVPAMLDVLAQLVSEPAFSEEEVSSARDRTCAELANDLDDPSVLADRGIIRSVLGAHPYGHDIRGSSAAVGSFSGEDLRRIHQQRFGPNLARLVAVGAVDSDRFFSEVERAFGGWRSQQATRFEVPTLRPSTHPTRLVIVDKPDQTQTQVRIGALAFPRSDPDYLASQVVNIALGGGFTSRLVDQVRVNRGLSYGIHSSFDCMRAAGWFGISTFTKTETTREIIDVSLAEVAKVRAKGLGSAELRKTQTFLSGIFPLRTETNEAIGAGLGEIRLYGLPDDWIERYRERVHAVTPAQAKAVSQKHFLPNGAMIVLVGRAGAIEPKVRTLGKVEVIKAAELE